MLVGADIVFSEMVVRTVGVGLQDAQFQTRNHQRHQCVVEVCLCDEVLVQRFLHCLEGGTALHVQARLDGDGAGFSFCLCDFVPFVDVGHGIAVGNDVSLEAPLLAQYVGEQEFAARSALAVDAVVGSHDGFDLSLLHQHAESGQVGLPQVAS